MHGLLSDAVAGIVSRSTRKPAWLPFARLGSPATSVTADRFGPQVPGLVINRFSCFVADCGGAPESVTFSVNVDVPAFVGVPVIAPLFAFKLSPAGNVPVKTLHVTGCAPPDSCR